MNGIIVLNKRSGITSQKAVSEIKNHLDAKKIGHAGTLDPLATGILVVLLNDATKLSDYLMAEEKTYQFDVLFGLATDTEDITGTVTDSEVIDSITEDEIDKVLDSLIGTLSQVPPMYSAIKQNGKKLYDLARAGLEVERTPRNVTIHHLKRISNIKKEDNYYVVTIEAIVSKGTYIRTLSTEIGRRLGHLAVMKTLCRTKSGSFTLENSSTIEDIKTDNFKVIDMLKALENYPQINLDDSTYRLVLNGVKLPNNKEWADEVVLSYNNQLVAIYQRMDDQFKAVRVWN